MGYLFASDRDEPREKDQRFIVTLKPTLNKILCILYLVFLRLKEGVVGWCDDAW